MAQLLNNYLFVCVYVCVCVRVCVCVCVCVLCACVCRDFLDVDMGRTKVVIGALSPLLALEDPELEEFLTRCPPPHTPPIPSPTLSSLVYVQVRVCILLQSELAHHMVRSCDPVPQRRPQTGRCISCFTSSLSCLRGGISECSATPPSIALGHSLCCVSQIILTQRTEVLEQECELGSVHFLLSKLPPDLRYEQMIVLAQQLFKKHPPDHVIRNRYSKLRSRYEELSSAWPY